MVSITGVVLVIQAGRYREGPVLSNLQELVRLLKPYDHLCLLYDTCEEQNQAVAQFFQAGLERDEKCLYIAGRRAAGEIKEVLKEAGLDIDNLEKSGRFAVVPVAGSCSARATCIHEAEIDFLKREAGKAREEGYSILRVCREAGPVTRDNFRSGDLSLYEANLNEHLPSFPPTIVLCPYNHTKADPEMIREALLNHPLLVRNGYLYHNHYYLEPEKQQNREQHQVENWLDNLERDRQFREALQKREDQLHQQSTYLLSLSAREAWRRTDLKTALEEITEVCSELIQTERVSVWWYNDDCSVISCYELYESNKKRHSSGEELQSKDFPGYTESHRDGEIIAVTDVFKDPRTSEIPAEYFNKHNIKSLMDTPIWMHDRICGLLSFEHTGETRTWARTDEHLATSMAALISFIVESAERESAERSLRENEEKYRKLAESTDAIPWEFDIRKNRWTYVAPQVGRILGYAPEEWTDLKFWTDRIHPDDRQWATEYCEECTRRGEDHVFEYRFIKKDGSVVWLHDDVTLELDQDRPVKLRGFMIDITERKKAEEETHEFNIKLEQKVKERTAQLEAVNRELEAFTYSVSHDLRAPLRAIDGFARIVLEDYGEKLDDEGCRLLQIIYDNTRQMDQLITDLLVLSQATRREIRKVAVNMGELVHTSYVEAAPEEVRKKFELLIQPLLPVTGDPNLIKQVWYNLLSNAVKFTSPCARRCVEVGGYREQDKNIYYVRDNGVGFDPHYSHKLFGVFQRLHGAKEFPGTGIGLAIVQRIVQRHGGEVWAEGDINQGAAFYFSLPDTQPEEVHNE